MNVPVFVWNRNGTSLSHKNTNKYLTCFIEFVFSLQVFEHKEARSGKVCPVRLSGPLLQDLKDYGKLVGEDREVPFLFQTNTGTFITPSVSVTALPYARTPVMKIQTQ
jgi:hypothetical protein